MAVLPDRLYGGDVAERQRFLPFGRRHPAKMNLALLGDLIRRYTLPGQTWLDPFFGVGSTGTAVLTGRSVIGIELEAHHAEDARKNVAHLARHARRGATATVIQGDSRRLRELLASAGSGALSSPPYADSVNSGEHGIDWTKAGPATGNRRRGEGTQHEATFRAQLNYGAPSGTLASPPYAESLTYHQAGAGGEGWELLRQGHTPAAIAAMRKAGDPAVLATRKGHSYGAPAGSISSPPYADVASRNRSQEPYASKDLARAKEYGQGDCARNVDGYGKDGAQIGNLPMGTVSSPPYLDARADWPTPEGAENVRYGETAGQIGGQNKETYLDAIREVYAAVYDVTPDGGVLVLVTGNYVRSGSIVDLAAHTIAVCTTAGWTPVERWQAKKQNVSFWRRLHARKGLPLIDWEDVLVFCRGDAPGWSFTDLPPQRSCAGVQPSLWEAAG